MRHLYFCSRIFSSVVAVWLFDRTVWMVFRYFLSTEDDPKRRHLYRYRRFFFNIRSDFPQVPAVCSFTKSVSSHSADTIPPFNRCCLSCEFKCGYVDVSFSRNMRYFLLNCKGEHPQPRMSRVRAFIQALYNGRRECFTSRHS